MKKIKTALTVLSAIIIAQSCQTESSPADVAMKFVKAISQSQWDSAKLYITANSIDTLNQMQANYEDYLPQSDSVKQIVSHAVIKCLAETKTDEATASVQLSAMLPATTNIPETKENLVLKKEKDGWKVNVQASPQNATAFLTVIMAMTPTAKDFFMPQLNYNKTNYNFYNPNSEDQATRERIYVTGSNGSCYVRETNFFNGATMATTVTTVEITPTEIRQVATLSTNYLETDKQRYYNPPKILLKLPKAGESATWTGHQDDGQGADGKGSEEEYTSSWTTVKVNGENKTAIKVEMQVPSIMPQGGYISYFVQGIGLWKINVKNNSTGEETPMIKFNGLSYVSPKEANDIRDYVQRNNSSNTDN